MAYDDTRWVHRLKRMGCWSELEARKRVEEVHGTIVSLESVKKQDMVEQQEVASGPAKEANRSSRADLKSLEDGFDKIDISGPTVSEQADEIETGGALTVMKEVKSIRGEARQEYGKVHAALAPFYDDIADSGFSADNLVFRRYKRPENQAQILSQLQSFAKCDITQGWSERVARLEHAVKTFETSALNEFRQGYETEDTDGATRKYAHVLWILNGAAGAIEVFIHHNHLMTRKSEYGSISDCIDSLDGQVKLQHTQAFLTRLSVALNEQVSIINRAFPPSLDLATPFLEKVGRDVLSPFFTALFAELHTTNIEGYLNAVSGTFVQCRNLSRNLLPIQNCDNFVQRWMDVVMSIYELHVDQYLAEELDYFRRISEAAVTEWDRQLSEQAASTESFLMSNINRQADKRDFLTSFKKVIMMPISILPSFGNTNKSNETKSDQLSAPTEAPKDNGRSPTVSHSPSPVPFTEDPPTTEFAAQAAIMKTKLEGIRSLFSIEVALNLVHTAKSSLERAAQFFNVEGDIRLTAKQQCEAIFVSLLRILGQRHVIGGFDKAVDHLSNYSPREQGEKDQSEVEPLVTFLELVNVGDLILQMMDVFYEQELVGTKLTDRNDFLDPAVKEKKKFEQVLDERVAAGLNKGIDVLMEEVDYILATRQLATDFNPGLSTNPHRATMEVSVTEAATAVVDVVSSHTRMLTGSTDKSTLDVFNQEVGLRLFWALCKHLKRQRISVEGSLRLIR